MTVEEVQKDGDRIVRAALANPQQAVPMLLTWLNDMIAANNIVAVGPGEYRAEVKSAEPEDGMILFCCLLALFHRVSWTYDGRFHTFQIGYRP